MNKFFTVIILVFSALKLLHAQDGYVKYNTDFDYRKGTIKCSKGEIVPFKKSAKTNKISVIIDTTTISDLTYPSKNFDTVANPNTSILSKKDELAQIQKGGMVVINVASIPQEDTVTVVGEKGNQLIQLIAKREAKIKQEDCGKSFRVIITNTPTIYYATETLSQFVESNPTPDNSGTEVPKDPKKGLDWWWYLLIGIGVVGIAVGIWLFFGRRNKKLTENENEVIFSGDSLTHFAKPYGGLDYLSSINPVGLIPPKNKWDKIKNNDEGKRKLKDLQGVKIKIKTENETFGFSDSVITESKPKASVNWLDEKREPLAQPIDKGNFEAISQQLRQLKTDLIQEIRSAGSKSNESANQIDALNKQIQDLKNDKSNLDSEKRILDSKIILLQNEKATINSELQSSISDKKHIDAEFSQLQERIIAVDYLVGYSDNVLSYLKLCSQVSIDAFDYFNRICKLNPQQANAVGYLLIDFQYNISLIPIGNWIQILQDINDTGVSNNQKIRNCFKQPVSIDDKKKEFQRLLFSEVLVRYSSNILILAEAFRNLGYFQSASELTNEAQQAFAKRVPELINKVKSTGLEIKYVPLFKNFEEFSGHTELANREKSFAYKEIDVEKEAIIEIVCYGVKTPFEDTKTLIILA